MKPILILSLLTLLSIALPALAVDPPQLPKSFQIAFDETYIDKNKTKYHVNGQVYYDSVNNRERVDRVNGRYNLFCGGVMPNTTTSCTQLTINDKRYLIFAQKKSCCFCCDSSHGCGILRRDWLDNATYLGVDKLIDTNYNKWSKDGSFGYNHYWSTISDSPIPRKLDENGDHITDYLTNTFVNKTFDDSYFTLPSYCSGACPSTTICGELRGDNKDIVEK